MRERWLLCRSAGCRLKEQQICDARLKRRGNAWPACAASGRRRVHHGRGHPWPSQKAVGRTHDLRGVFTSRLAGRRRRRELVVVENAEAIQDERDLQGVYLLRATTPDLGPDELWNTYMLLTRVEAAFRNLKTDLCMRPIFHHKAARADAHVLFAVLAYALSVTIQLRHRSGGGTHTTAALLETLERLQLAELSFRTAEGERLRFERLDPDGGTARAADDAGLTDPGSLSAAEPGDRAGLSVVKNAAAKPGKQGPSGRKY